MRDIAPGIGFRVLDWGLMVSGFWISGFGFRVSGGGSKFLLPLLEENWGLGVGDWGFRVSGLGFLASGFGFRGGLVFNA